MKGRALTFLNDNAPKFERLIVRDVVIYEILLSYRRNETNWHNQWWIRVLDVLRNMTVNS